MTNWKQLRESVLTRCEYYCEKCGNGLSESFALHHRKLKSRGGKDTVDNLLALHHECHNLGTGSVRCNVALSELKGYIVPRHAEPSQYPLTLPNESIVTLTTLGTYEYIERKANYGF